MTKHSEENSIFSIYTDTTGGRKLILSMVQMLTYMCSVYL